jgi:pimeloyl-ACP methyl ester carboxylesterase
VFVLFSGLSAQPERKTLYLIPGQGSDYRIYRYFKFEGLDTVHVHYSVPRYAESMNSYARRLSQQIDTCDRYSIVGVSLGGMLAVEMSEFMNPEETIIISSAKNRHELPFRYRFMNKIPLNDVFGGAFLNATAPYAQIVVEPDSRHERDTCLSMLKNKNELFMERSVDMIVNWERDSSSSDIFHIHGNADRTIPIENVKDIDVVIEGGSHMMALTKGRQIAAIVKLKVL